MPKHLKQLPTAHRTAGTIPHIEGYLLADTEFPRHLAAIAHPFRVCLGLLGRDGYRATNLRLAHPAVVRHDRERRPHLHCCFLPAKEAVQLSLVGTTPGARLHHQVRGLQPGRLVFWQLPQLRHSASLGRIAQEELDKERARKARLSIVCRQAMPPPVVAAPGLLAKQLARIARYIMSVEAHIRISKLTQ